MGLWEREERVNLLDNNEQDLAVINDGCSKAGAQGCFNNETTTICQGFDDLGHWSTTDVLLCGLHGHAFCKSSVWQQPNEAKTPTIWIGTLNAIRHFCLFNEGHEKELSAKHPGRRYKYAGRRYKHGEVEDICISYELAHTAALTHFALIAMNQARLNIVTNHCDVLGFL